MSASFRLLLLLPLLHLFVVVTPLKLKAQVGPFAAAFAQDLQDETPDDGELEFHVPVLPAFVVPASAPHLSFDPPAPEDILLDRERPKPRA